MRCLLYYGYCAIRHFGILFGTYATPPIGGRPMTDGFSDMSNNNDEWLDGEACCALLSEHLA